MRRISLFGVIFVLCLGPLIYPMLRHILEGQQYMNEPLLSHTSATLGTAFFPGVGHWALGRYVRHIYAESGFPFLRVIDFTGNLFIGYSVIFLCLYTVMKLRHLKQRFWSAAMVFFLLLAFGPHLQVVPYRSTRIPLLYVILNRLPLLKTARVPERFMVIVMFCGSVLVGYACWDLFRRVRFRKTLFVFLTLVMAFEFFHVYPIEPMEPTPQFYQKFGQDQESYVILELTQLTEKSHVARLVTLYQISHEKKLFTGFITRISPEVFKQAYRFYRPFDDLFVLPEDLWKQADPALIKIDREMILTLLAHYNVRYVALYNDYAHGEFRSNTERLSELFGPPIGIDQHQGICLFQVDTPSSAESVIFPGHGMFPLYLSPEGKQIRQASRDADIHILNLDRVQQVHILFEGKRDVQTNQDLRVQIFVNDEFITTVTIGAEWQQVTLPPLPLQAGENSIRFFMPDIPVDEWWRSMYMRNIHIDFF
jgi:hypothetical protein